jgi:hypothetical protein
VVAVGALSEVGISAADQGTASYTGVSDLYAVSDAQLQACGLTEVPLSSTTPLPGGGESYHYTMSDGQTYSVIRPPAGFEPRTASASEDAAYGVPPAPSPLSPGYASWLTLTDGDYAPFTMHPYIVVTDRPITQAQATTVPTSSAPPPASSSVWAGYTQAGSGWTENQVAYPEPVLSHTNCTDPQVSFWAGIGNQANALGQAGTESGEPPNGALHQVFIENLPAGAFLPGVTVTAPDQVIANVQYLGNAQWTYTMTVNGRNLGGYAGTGGYDGSVVEAITERPDGAPLLNFGSVSMSARVGRGLGNMTPTKRWDMTGYATTNPIASGNFTVNQNNCNG